jgi:hypothetical protein
MAHVVTRHVCTRAKKREREDIEEGRQKGDIGEEREKGAVIL